MAYSYQLIPYYRDRLFILSAAAETVLGATAYAGAPYGAMGKAGRAGSLYREFRFNSGHRHLTYMTGAGVFRADRARQDRTPLRVIKLRYPPTGTLIDRPFFLHYPVPDLTVIVLRIDAFVPPGGAVVGIIHNAATGLPLIADGVGRFLLTRGQKQYYVRFTFTRGHEQPDARAVQLRGRGGQLPREAGAGSGDRRVQPGGRDLASRAAARTRRRRGALRGRGLLPGSGPAEACGAGSRRGSRPATTRGRADLYSTLYLGETAPDGIEQVPRMQEGVGMYSRYDVPCGPMWNRVADQVVMSPKDFGIAEEPPGRQPGRQPRLEVHGHPAATCSSGRGCWRTSRTSTRRNSGTCGSIFGPRLRRPRNTSSCQSMPLRVWIHDRREATWTPTSIFDGERGHHGADGEPRGMWRVLPQPVAPYNAAHAVRAGAGRRGRRPPVAVHHAAAYGANCDVHPAGDLPDPLRAAGSEPRAWRRAGRRLSGDRHGRQVPASMTNYASFHATPLHPLPDPNHPDYLGRCVGILAVDAFAWTRRRSTTSARRVYDRTCHARSGTTSGRRSYSSRTRATRTSSAPGPCGPAMPS